MAAEVVRWVLLAPKGRPVNSPGRQPQVTRGLFLTRSPEGATVQRPTVAPSGLRALFIARYPGLTPRAINGRPFGATTDPPDDPAVETPDAPPLVPLRHSSSRRSRSRPTRGSSTPTFKAAKPDDLKDVDDHPGPEGGDGLVRRQGLLEVAEAGRQGPGQMDPQGRRRHGGREGARRHRHEGEVRRHVQAARRVPRAERAGRGQGQGRGNSGVYLQGRYEVQILDSYGIERAQERLRRHLRRGQAPKENACKAPTVWQSYDIDLFGPEVRKRQEDRTRPHVGVS